MFGLSYCTAAKIMKDEDIYSEDRLFKNSSIIDSMKLNSSAIDKLKQVKPESRVFLSY